MSDDRLVIMPMPALVAVLRPRTVVEIGTAEGMSALSMLTALPDNGRVITIDLVPWEKYPNTILKAADFSGGRLEQRLTDLADPVAFRQQAAVLAEADLLFVDAPKDGYFEPRFIANMSGLARSSPLLVVFDDIRVTNMLAVWRELNRPKMDLTSFGHWSGTGLVEWRGV